ARIAFRSRPRSPRSSALVEFEAARAAVRASSAGSRLECPLRIDLADAQIFAPAVELAAHFREIAHGRRRRRHGHRRRSRRGGYGVLAGDVGATRALRADELRDMVAAGLADEIRVAFTLGPPVVPALRSHREEARHLKADGLADIRLLAASTVL